MLSLVANWERVGLRINPHKDYEYFGKLCLDFVA